MCYRCDYRQLIEAAGLGATPHRLRVLEVIGNNRSPLSAQEVHDILRRTHDINRVTVYRNLDALVDRGLVQRISGGGRSFFYGIAPNENHHPHPHFFCTACGDMECLDPESLRWSTDRLERTFPGRIENVEVRIDGICRTCLKTGEGASGAVKRG
jgi:Fur family ferric uptake transcriptional regulator